MCRDNVAWRTLIAPSQKALSVYMSTSTCPRGPMWTHYTDSAFAEGAIRVHVGKIGFSRSTWTWKTRDILIAPSAKALSVEPRQRREEEGGAAERRTAESGRVWRVAETSVELGGGIGARSGVSQQQQRQWCVVACGGPVVRQNSGDGQWRRDLRRREREGASNAAAAASMQQ
ncbi:hypothetical protein Scep_007330 [Stephania cephalantha]|uniref:Uncharacterized protein n=1 Tax=Stephania cephalantha TaxID=152367 RepID=A0AAP0K9K5_9MAGN